MDATDNPERTRELLATLQQLTGVACAACGGRLCGHEAVLSVVLGYRNRPHCAGCLGAALAEPSPAMCERALQWVLRRECFLRGWLWASAVEGFPQETRPPCLFPPSRAADAVSVSAGAAVPDAALEPDDTWDAGDMSCGDLVLELRLRLRGMAPGAVLAVRATDPAAPIDIPAWCGLTGHTLLHSRHPDYAILRRDDP